MFLICIKKSWKDYRVERIMKERKKEWKKTIRTKEENWGKIPWPERNHFDFSHSKKERKEKYSIKEFSLQKKKKKFKSKNIKIIILGRSEKQQKEWKKK